MEANSHSVSEGIELWIARHEGTEELGPWVFLLSEDERRRLGTIQSARRRNEFVIARAMARTALAQRLGLRPDEVGFVIEPEGRPRLDPKHGQEWSFSISHTDGMVVLAVSRTGTVGVDVEARDRERDVLALARRFFHPREHAYVAAAANERDCQQRFLRIWTLKEAYLKALGTGVSGALSSFEFCFVEATRALRFIPGSERIDPTQAWDFEIFEPSDGHVLALAYLKQPGEKSPRVRRYQLTVPGLGERRIEHDVEWSGSD